VPKGREEDRGGDPITGKGRLLQVEGSEVWIAK